MHSQPVKKFSRLGLKGAVVTIIVIAFLYPFYQRSYDQGRLGSDNVRADIPDFREYQNVVNKKKAFFEYLLPEVKAHNEALRKDRMRVLDAHNKLASNDTLSFSTRSFLLDAAETYRIEADKVDQTLTDKLLKRIDIIPPALVLAQAANESAWGTSRFARQGYNFFGMWCFKQGCGFVPRQRSDDAAHEVAKFDSLSQAVKSYLLNLNRHYAYTELREIRYALRNNQKKVTAEALAHGLMSYSERGQDYIDELIAMINYNRKYMSQ